MDGEQRLPRSRPPTRQIVIGQKVQAAKIERAKEFRRNSTEAERVLWQHLRANRMCGLQFRRQQVIDGFIADFYCHAVGLVVEVDGPVHEQQSDYDVERDRILSARNLHVLRVTNEQVISDLDGVLARIASCITERLSAVETLPE